MQIADRGQTYITKENINEKHLIVIFVSKAFADCTVQVPYMLVIFLLPHSISISKSKINVSMPAQDSNKLVVANV